MTKCSFCGIEEHDFKGVHLIKNDGAIDFFCGSKCRKNSLKLGRDKRRMKWTEAYRLSRAKAEADAARLKEKAAEVKAAKSAKAEVKAEKKSKK
jgi:large subunit ribosomal protein L24e